MAQIQEELVGFNPWWKESFSIEFKEREAYGHIQKFLPMKQIIALTGLRRVGKTTIMLKLVEDYIKSGFGPRNIIYFSFDEFRETEIRQVLKEFGEITGKNPGDGKYLLLLDEIQKLENWENQIKTVYDRVGKNTKIIISGSESLFIKKKSRETLAGRIFEFKVEPLSFKEFLQFKKARLEPKQLYERELSRLFEEFTVTQGFPELVGVKEKEIVKKYTTESIVGRVIYKDMQQLFKIKDITLIESILRIFMEEPGQLTEISSLSKELGISRQALSTYLHYLEQSFLLRKLYNFSKSRRKTERKLKKYYPTIISTRLLFEKEKHSKSKVFEWQAINQLKPEFFWRDPYKNEVDAIMTKEKTTPVEIKYGKTDTKGLLAFMEKFNARQGYIISKEQERKQKIGKKTIITTPAYKFFSN